MTDTPDYVDELRKKRTDALYEFIADRLGEHDASRNVPDASGSGEYTTMLVTDWSVDDLARYIVDEIPHELLKPINERTFVRRALAAVDHVITQHQPVELRKETLAEDVELILAGRKQARDACETIAIERDDALADVKALQAVAFDERETTIRVAAQRDKARHELDTLRGHLAAACDDPDFKLGRGLLKVSTVRALLAQVDMCTSCGGSLDSPPCQRNSVTGEGGHLSGPSRQGQGGAS